MRVSAKDFLWLLPLLLMGCSHRSHTVAAPALAPPIAEAPLPPADTVSKASLPPPVIGTDTPTAKAETTAEQAPSEPAPPVKKPVKHIHKPAAEQAAASEPEVSAIGQLSTGNPDGPTGEKIEASIKGTEKSLSEITRPLSVAEQRTAAQIREFLKEARQALATGDTDGAGTLAKKAQVLLSELNS